MTLGYYAMCSEVDHHFGRLMAKLKEKGVDESTLVVFTSDHGENFGAHAAQNHKGNPHDVSVRVPLLMRMPGRLPEGQVAELLVGGLDIPSTLLGLMGMSVPGNWQGKNLAQAIMDGDDEAVDSVPIFNFKPSWRGVYTRRYTFAFENVERTRDISSRFRSDLPDDRTHTPNFNVLYDRQTDPLQEHNLVNSTEHIPVAMDLTEATHCWLDAFQDPFLSYRHLYAIVGDREDRPPIDLINSDSLQ